ncbi:MULTISPECIES: hypothetical protein [Mesorhizobium]|uniref:hypothetical protein n=1 Tax=Mesorhizobium TaxID=68287 RepID=UPI001FE8BE23|nr:MULTISPECIES: hypothetical protein [Mesorhizobium]
MTIIGSTPASQTASSRDAFTAVRHYLGGRRGLIAAAAAAAVAGLAFNWAWLVAAGIAPLLLSVLPCVAMCALGLCMHRMTGRSCKTDDASQKKAVDDPNPIPADLKGNG